MSVLSLKGSDVTITNASLSLPRIMAGKELAQIWHEEISSLYHPMCVYSCPIELQTAQLCIDSDQSICDAC